MSFDVDVWCWLIAGALLMALEAVAPGFVIFFYGISAVVAGVIEIFFDIPFVLLLLLWFALGTALLFSCRRFFPDVFKGSVRKRVKPEEIDDDETVGALAAVVGGLTANLPGKVEFRGTLWSAVSDCDLRDGELAKVVRRENLTLFVTARR